MYIAEPLTPAPNTFTTQDVQPMNYYPTYPDPKEELRKFCISQACHMLSIGTMAYKDDKTTLKIAKKLEKYITTGK